MLNILSIRKGQLIWLDKGVSCRIVRGHAWITLTGRPDDHVLAAGETLPPGAATVLVECLSDELWLEVTKPRRSWAWRWSTFREFVRERVARRFGSNV